MTRGAAGWVAPVRAADGQLRTVHVRVNVSRRDSVCETKRDGDLWMSEDGWRARAHVDGGGERGAAAR